jgi:5-methylcytosine-specific restriction endonuclease McrA
MKITITALDRLFSQYIRQRDGFTCQRCGKSAKPRGLHAAHIFGRGKKSVRWNPDNCVTLCLPCHRWVDSHQTEKEAWQRQRLGGSRWNDLQRMADTPGKPDTVAIAVWLKQELQRMEHHA